MQFVLTARCVNLSRQPAAPKLLSVTFPPARPTGQLAYAVGEGWRARYPIQINEHRHIVATTLILLGDVYLRAHRITLDEAAERVIAEEGSAPLGYDAGAVPTIRAANG